MFTKHNQLRRCGVGLACINEHGTLLWAIRFNLPGPVQTVARGELFAILRAAQLAEEGATIDFVTDNQGNFNKFNSGRDLALLSNNGDMFKLLFEQITLKNLDFKVRWMPSHSERKGIELPPDVTPIDVIGNDFADKQADLAAIDHVIDLNASACVLWYSNLAARIQKRNVCIMASLEARKKDIKPHEEIAILPKVSPPENLFPFSSHVPFNTGTGFIRCARCNQSYSRKHEYVKKWLISDCPLINSDIDRPRPLSLELLHIGNRAIHPSHKINTFRGIVYCRICGSKVGKSASGFIKLLAKPCKPPGTYGIRNIKRLSNGLLPVGCKTWPCDEVPDAQVAKRIRGPPLSSFVSQVLEDHPGLTTAEAKIVADTLLRCADHAASQSPAVAG